MCGLRPLYAEGKVTQRSILLRSFIKERMDNFTRFQEIDFVTNRHVFTKDGYLIVAVGIVGHTPGLP